MARVVGRSEDDEHVSCSDGQLQGTPEYCFFLRLLLRPKVILGLKPLRAILVCAFTTRLQGRLQGVRGYLICSICHLRSLDKSRSTGTITVMTYPNVRERSHMGFYIALHSALASSKILTSKQLVSLAITCYAMMLDARVRHMCPSARA